MAQEEACTAAANYSPEDGARFLADLILRGRLTPYQADSLINSSRELLVIEEHAILDRLGSRRGRDVFKARSRRDNKIVLLELISGSVHDRLESVAIGGLIAAASQLQHPNILAVHGLVRQNGSTYLVQEDFEGVDLTTLVDKHGVVPLEASIAYFQQAALALAYAHQHGLTHGHLTPADILVAADSRVKVVGIGLAEIESAEPAPNAELSGTAMAPPIVTSPSSGVSPIQAMRDIADFGAVLYYALQGCDYRPGQQHGSGASNDLPQPLRLIFKRMVAIADAMPYVSMQAVVDEFSALDTNVRSSGATTTSTARTVDDNSPAVPSAGHQRSEPQPSARADSFSATTSTPTIDAKKEQGLIATAIHRTASSNGYRIDDEPIAGYVLKSFLGEGGFGEVWKAEGPGQIEVAIKVINLARKEGYKELKALGLIKRIRHPNLVPLTLIWVKSSDGRLMDDAHVASNPINSAAPTSLASLQGPPLASQLIMVMGLCDQSTYDRLVECKQRGLKGIPLEELLTYMADAASGIDFLNQSHPIEGGDRRAPIQHCDIKPQNLMIVGGRVQVGDFGLAQALDPDIVMTSMGISAAYGAPECHEGNPPSSSTDQYSLAVSYIELRTGTLPFKVLTAEGAKRAHLTGKLDFSGVSRAEACVLRRATSRRPRDRYASSSEMVRELRIASAQPDRTPRRHWITAALLVPLLLAGGAWWYFATSGATQIEAEMEKLLGQNNFVAALARLEAPVDPVRPEVSGRWQQRIQDEWLQFIHGSLGRKQALPRLAERRTALQQLLANCDAVSGHFPDNKHAQALRARIADSVAACSAMRVFAIVVGVNRCSHFQLPDGLPSRGLEGAEADAGEFAQLLAEEYGVPNNQIHLLQGEQATHQAIETAFTAVSDEIQHGDQFIFYFSGYGTQFCEIPGRETRYLLEPRPRLDEAICPVDATNTGDSIILDDELASWLEKVNGENGNRKLACSTVILDCCPSGLPTAAEGEPIAKYLPRRQTQTLKDLDDKEPWVDLEGTTNSVPRLVGLYASEANQSAYEGIVGKNSTDRPVGYFSHCLVGALREAATEPNLSRLSRLEVERRVNAQLAGLPFPNSTADAGQQHMVLMTDGSSDAQDRPLIELGAREGAAADVQQPH